MSVSVVAGCASKPKRTIVTPPATMPADSGLRNPSFFAAPSAFPAPPLGWSLDKETGDDRFRHLVWISPTGRTAYGIIFFKLPLPVGHELALQYGFLNEMKKNTGEANLLGKRWDPSIEALRFEVEGGLYSLRSSFYVRGLEGWAVYAGTRRDQPLESDELKLAEKAREHTTVNAEPKK
ncbi:MAG: hypothetical protein QM770_12390 [Tepidisphaeraceae bacterium]